MKNITLILFLAFLACEASAVKINLLYGDGFGGSLTDSGQTIGVQSCTNPDDQPNACDFLRELSDYLEHVRLTYTELDNSESDSITVTFRLVHNHYATASTSVDVKYITFNSNNDFSDSQMLLIGLHEYMHVFGISGYFNQYWDFRKNDIWLGQIGQECAVKTQGAQELKLVPSSSHLDETYTDLMTASGGYDSWIEADGLGIGACMFSDMYKEPLIDIGVQLIAPVTSNIELHIDNHTTNAKDGFTAENIRVDITYPEGTTPMNYPENCLIEEAMLTCLIDSIEYGTYEIINFNLSDGDSSLSTGQYDIDVRVWHLDPHIDPQPLNNIIDTYFTVVIYPEPEPPPFQITTDGGGGSVSLLFIALLAVLCLSSSSSTHKLNNRYAQKIKYGMKQRRSVSIVNPARREVTVDPSSPNILHTKVKKLHINLDIKKS